MDLWAEADDELIGRPWDDLVLDSLRGALDDLETRFGADPEGWRWGEVHEMEFPHPLGSGEPAARTPAESAPPLRRGPGDRLPGGL